MGNNICMKESAEFVIEKEVFASISIGGREIPFITGTTVTMWVVMALILAAALILTRKLKAVPGKRQAAVELFVSFTRNLADAQIGAHHGRIFAPYLGTMLLFLVVANMVGVFNVIPHSAGFSLHPPTKDFNMTLMLALISVALTVVAEFRYKGVKGWLRTFYTPTPVSAFVKVLDYIVRPLSLCLRLFGNILGATIVMALLYGAMPIALPAVFGLYFDLFDAVLQSYVFVFLTSLYLSEACEE